MLTNYRAEKFRAFNFKFSVCHFSRAKANRPTLRLILPYKGDVASSSLSYYADIVNHTETQAQPTVELCERTLKSAYSAKHAQNIRRLCHSLYQLADHAHLVLLAFTLTFPGSGDEVALACENSCRFAVRAFLAKLKFLNSAKSVTAVYVYERAKLVSPLHVQGIMAIQPESLAHISEESVHRTWLTCIDEQSQTVGVDLRRGADGVLNRKAHVYLKPVRNKNAYADYLSKSDTKTPLLLSDKKRISYHPWFGASRSCRIEAKKSDFKCHFQAPSFFEGLRIIDEQLLPAVNKIARKPIWCPHFDTFLNKRTGSRCQVKPIEVAKVIKALKRFQREKIRNQVAFLHCPDVIVRLDIAGNLSVCVREKKLVRGTA